MWDGAVWVCMCLVCVCVWYVCVCMHVCVYRTKDSPSQYTSPHTHTHLRLIEEPNGNGQSPLLPSTETWPIGPAHLDISFVVQVNLKGGEGGEARGGEGRQGEGGEARGGEGRRGKRAGIDDWKELRNTGYSMTGKHRRMHTFGYLEV